MSLKLKCNKCGFLLGFETQNPGVIAVEPCEGCIQQVSDVAQPRTTGQFWATVDEKTPDMLGETELPALIDRINEYRKGEEGTEDGNNWRPTAER